MGFSFVAVASAQTSSSGTSGTASSTLNVQSGDLLVGMFGYRGLTELSGLVMSETDGTSNVMTLLSQDHSANHSGVMGYKIAASANAAASFRVAHTESVAYRTWVVYQFRPDGGETVELDGGRNVAQGNSTAPASASFSTTGTDEVIVGFLSKYALRTTSSPLIAGAAADGSNLFDYASAWYKIFTETQSSITARATLATSTNWIQYAVAFKSAGAGGIKIPVVIALRKNQGA